ncbi:MAG: TAXI family TRAP transporter solute-binding subunit [Sumerlaeia bacterium]
MVKQWFSGYLPWVVFALVLVGLVFWFLPAPQKSVLFKISAGDSLGSRHRIASVLGDLAKEKDISFTFIPTDGSQTVIEKVASGELDLAFVQGGLPAPESVQQVALIYPEPLHILVRPEILGQGINGLKGKRLNLSTEGSGTRLLAKQVLEFAEITPKDYTATDFTYEALLELPEEELPDALFMVQSLPSKTVGQLVRNKGYKLLPIPFGESLRFRDIAILETTIPEQLYSVSLNVPSDDLPAVGAYLTLIARDDVDAQEIFRLLQVVFDHEFARKAKIPNLREDHLETYSPYSLHAGARLYLNRNEPFLRSDFIEGIENARSFLFSLVVALFLLRTWIVQQRSHSFEPFLEQITKIERELLESETEGQLTITRLKELRKELSLVKSDVVDRYVEGKLKGTEMMNGFLAHVNDVRDYLHSLHRELVDKQK